MALTLTATCPSEAKIPEVSHSADTTTIVENGDTVKITDKVVKEAISEAISDAINDTVWNDTDTAVERNYRENERNDQAVAMRWADVAQEATVLLLTSVVVVVFLCLLFYFLHRKAKYRVMEKAIEKGYPLPPSLGGFMPQKPVSHVSSDAWRGVAAQPQQRSTQPQSMQSPAGNDPMPLQPPLFYRTNYRAYKSSISLICVGVSLALFFAFANAIPLVWLMLLISFLGIGKALIIHKEQQQDRAYWEWQMEQQRTYMPQQPQPDLQNVEQPPVFNQPSHSSDK